MKKVKIKIGMSYIGSKGCVFAVIDDGLKTETISKIIEAKSPNESLILGISEILKNISKDCTADIYVQTNFGFRFMQNKKKWCNRNAGDILLSVAKESNIELNFIDSSSTGEVDSMKDRARTILLKEVRLDDVRNEENIPVPNIEPKSSVKIFVRGVVDTSDVLRPGKYVALLSCKGVEKEIFGFGENTTGNRMVMQGAIEAIKKLKHPCKIELNTHTDIGVETKSKANFDLLHDLRKVALEGGHILESKVSNERQDELALKLKQIKCR